MVENEVEACLHFSFELWYLVEPLSRHPLVPIHLHFSFELWLRDVLVVVLLNQSLSLHFSFELWRAWYGLRVCNVE